MTDKERLEEHTHVAVKIGEYKDLKEQAERVEELEDDKEFLHGVINKASKSMENLINQSMRYCEVVESMKSEINYALHSNKSKDVKRFYLENAVRFADEALRGESDD